MNDDDKCSACGLEDCGWGPCQRREFDEVRKDRDAARQGLAMAKRILLDIAEELDEMGDNYNARHLCNKATYGLGQIERTGL